MDKKADIWVFPILHCIVHSIELDLKAINFYLAKLLNVEPKIEGQHKIQQICCTASKRLDEIKKQNLLNNCGELILAIKVVKNFIDNIYKNTNDMSFVRYPINRKKDPMFYTMSYENVVVDIEKMRDQYTYVCLMMEGVLNCIFAQLDSNG